MLYNSQYLANYAHHHINLHLEACRIEKTSCGNIHVVDDFTH